MFYKLKTCALICQIRERELKIAPNNVWRPSWIKENLLLRKMYGKKEEIGKGKGRGREGKGTSRKPLLLWILNSRYAPVHYG